MTFLKNRPQGKKMGIILLVALIAISVAEVIFRAVVLGMEAVLTTANLGEQLAVIALAVTILIMTAKGKDRACYILFGAWIAYFVLDQLFELPGMVSDFIYRFGMSGIGTIGVVARILSMIFIIIIGSLLVEYMNDGTIYNKAFNILCVATVVLLFVSIGISIYASITVETILMLDVFNNLYRITMIFLFTFFAYDSAKAQLKKTDFTK
jgi:hypothetical protein